MSAPQARMPGLDQEQRLRLGRRAQWLAGASVAYNSVEAIIALSAGTAASSIALVGFGLDSIVEMSSGLVILWQFRHPIPESRERTALRAIAVAFFALALYVAQDSARALIEGHAARQSAIGIGLALVSLIVMPILSIAQRRTGRRLSSSTVVADSKQTLLCTYLSAVLLVGLLLNASVGWWWADPLVGLVVAALALREGLDAWKGEACGCVPGSAGEAPACHGDCSDGCDVADASGAEAPDAVVRSA